MRKEKTPTLAEKLFILTQECQQRFEGEENTDYDDWLVIPLMAMFQIGYAKNRVEIIEKSMKIQNEHDWLLIVHEGSLCFVVPTQTDARDHLAKFVTSIIDILN